MIYSNPSNLKEKDIDKFTEKSRVLIYNNDGEILLSHYNGIYMLPGGKCEKGENSFQALKREIKEELGVSLDVEKVKYLNTLYQYQANYIKANGDILNRLVKTNVYIVNLSLDLTNLNNNLSEREKADGFRLLWVKKEDLPKLLKEESINPRKIYFDEELKLIMNDYLKDDKYIDMHTHTIYSDGELTPEELIKQAKENNIGVLSITDHDTINALKYIDENKENIDLEYIKLIPGVELSAASKKGTMHILGYDIDINNKELNEELNNQRKRRTYRVITLLNQLKLDYNIEFSHDDIKELFSKKGNLGRVDLAKLCVKYGYASSTQDAFDKYLIEAYEKVRDSSDKLSYIDCINLIKNANGYAVLAHPYQLLLEDSELEELIVKMKEEGLSGIEAYHSGHTKEDIEKYLELAKKYDLVITSGSDFHGINVKPEVKLAMPKIKTLSK